MNYKYFFKSIFIKVLFLLLSVFLAGTLFAEKKQGFFIGAVYYPSASVNLTLSCDTCYNELSESKSGYTGSGAKFGFQFENNWRLYFSNETFSKEEFADLTYNLLNADFIADNGFFIGLGLGSGEIDGGFQHSGSASSFQLGWNFETGNFLSIEIGAKNSSFRASEGIIDFDYSTTGLFAGVNILFNN